MMRYRLWRWVKGDLREGSLLPRRLLVLRAILFPLDFFYWRMNKGCGYRAEDDTWNIHGVRYTEEALRTLANAHGEVYRVTRTGECVTFERIASAESNRDFGSRR